MSPIINLMLDSDHEENRRRLVERLRKSGYIRSDSVQAAMEAVPREKFVPEYMEDRAYVDTPLPIGHGQTISAPSMIAIMLEELDLHTGQKVLEIGTGSGYNATLIYEMVKCRVYTVERLPELAELARSNLETAGYGEEVIVVVGDGTEGYEEESPYDRIMVTAGAPKMPPALAEQLKVGGMIGIPVGSNRGFQEFVTGTKKEDGDLEIVSHGGCAFVPLIGKDGWGG